MTDQEAKAFCETWFDRLWTKLDATVIEEMCAEDIKTYGLAGPQVGREPFNAFYQAIKAVFPHGLRFTVEHALARDTSAMVRLHAEGTSANGKPVAFDGFAQITVVDGKMTEGWNTFDFLTMLEQCGALPTGSLGAGMAGIAGQGAAGTAGQGAAQLGGRGGKRAGRSRGALAGQSLTAGLVG